MARAGRVSLRARVHTRGGAPSMAAVDAACASSRRGRQAAVVPPAYSQASSCSGMQWALGGGSATLSGLLAWGYGGPRGCFQAYSGPYGPAQQRMQSRLVSHDCSLISEHPRPRYSTGLPAQGSSMPLHMFAACMQSSGYGGVNRHVRTLGAAFTPQNN